MTLLSNFSDQPVYYYNFMHRSQSVNLAKLIAPTAALTNLKGIRRYVLMIWNIVLFSLNLNFLGVGHADEIGIIFNSKFLPPLTAQEDIKVSNMLLDLWTSFAKNGYKKKKLLFKKVSLSFFSLFSVPKSTLLPDNWLPYQVDAPRYLKIKSTDAGMMNQSMPFMNRLPFWEGLLE